MSINLVSVVEAFYNYYNEYPYENYVYNMNSRHRAATNFW